MVLNFNVFAQNHAVQNLDSLKTKNTNELVKMRQIDSLNALHNNPNYTAYTLGDTTKKVVNKQVEGMISFAKTLLGTPYRYSGSTPSGFDCSGFISYVLGNFGFSFGRSSYTIAEFGKTVRLAEIQPGDLMFFKGRNANSSQIGHIAMVIEVNENEINFIHSSTSRGVVIENFKTSKYYIPRFVKAKRMDYGGGQ